MTNFVPKISGQGSLGYSNRRWDKLHVEEVDCTGEISASTYQGDGSQLTGITATATSMGGTMTAHIIPSENAQFDLGNAERKIRHLFLSDNSLWVGDNHKISIQEGKMKFKKMGLNTLPTELQGKGIADDPSTLGIKRLEELSHQHGLFNNPDFAVTDLIQETDFEDDAGALDKVELPQQSPLADPATLPLGTMVYDMSEHNVKVVASDDDGATNIWKTLSFS